MSASSQRPTRGWTGPDLGIDSRTLGTTELRNSMCFLQDDVSEVTNGRMEEWSNRRKNQQENQQDNLPENQRKNQWKNQQENQQENQ